ncbi:MAG: alpha/beta hydrolase-fold protein [Verrucomicrobiota bacterium]
MNPFLQQFTCGIVMVLLGTACPLTLAAQPAATPETPAAPAARGAGAAAGRGGRGGGGAVNSPEVNVAERTFTVRFRAPNAQSVTVIGELDGKEHPMTKADNGVWSAIIGPLAPDTYNYQFRVDGVVAMDPANPNVKIGFGGFPPANLVEIPGPETAFQDTRDVPHGTVRLETYHAKALGGAARTLWIYTPPGYDGNAERYPVFYLLHGSGNTDSSWFLTGRENTILDNLIADGKAKPMILVNPLGYERTGIGTGPDQNLNASGGTGFWFEKEFLQDIIPYVDGKFRTVADADHRALGGLSMGGGHTIQIGFPNLDTFHSLVIMSMGAQNADRTYPTFFADPAATNKKLKFLWVGVGSDDTLVGANARALEATLTARGINHAPFWILPGARHEWVVWRYALRDVAPQLFR